MDERLARRRLFGHLNGLVVAPLALALQSRGVMDHLLGRGSASTAELVAKFGGNEGYLNCALRALASMGYADYSVAASSGEVTCKVNGRTAAAAALFPHYRPLVEFQRMAIAQPDLSGDVLAALADRCRRLQGGWLPAGIGGGERDGFLQHVEGGILSFLLVRLGMAGAFSQLPERVDLRSLDADPSARRGIVDLLRHVGWWQAAADAPTPLGLYFLQRAASYGVPVSYLHSLTHAEELLFGDPAVLERRAEQEDERHVDRRMNVWGSGNTHGSYFRALERSVIQVFDGPLDCQPAGILDMGCGDGALLARLYRAVTTKALRGRHLGERPLQLFGVDYNQAALDVTRRELDAAGVPATLLWGDIGRPELLAETLLREQGVKLGSLLNVRTFLDHNRPWSAPQVSGLPGLSTGAYACRGRRLANGDVEQSLIEHFTRWSPYVRRHGLLLVELHTIDPALAGAHQGDTLAPAYDVTHGLSDQYILELPVFEQCAMRAGLQPDPSIRRRFPDSDLATVSVNLLRAPDRRAVDRDAYRPRDPEQV